MKSAHILRMQLIKHSRCRCRKNFQIFSNLVTYSMGRGTVRNMGVGQGECHVGGQVSMSGEEWG